MAFFRSVRRREASIAEQEDGGKSPRNCEPVFYDETGPFERDRCSRCNENWEMDEEGSLEISRNFFLAERRR